MKCGYCGAPFDEDRSQPACRHCPVGSGCGLIRCPQCGYENPGMPGWISFLKKRLGPALRESPPESRRGVALPMLGPKA